jgi:adenylate kinase
MPGAGKGGISQIMSWQPNTVHISTGDLFRSLDPESELGKRVAEIINSGNLVGDDIVNEMVAPKLTPGRDLLLDGYPRSIPQVEWLLNKVDDTRFDVIAFFLEISEEVSLFRRDKRVANALQKGEAPRKDDLDPTILPKRFAEYREKTEPMIEFLRKRLGDNFFTIDASVVIEDVYSEIMKILFRK